MQGRMAMERPKPHLRALQQKGPQGGLLFYGLPQYARHEAQPSERLSPSVWITLVNINQVHIENMLTQFGCIARLVCMLLYNLLCTVCSPLGPLSPLE